MGHQGRLAWHEWDVVKQSVIIINENAREDIQLMSIRQVLQRPSLPKNVENLQLYLNGVPYVPHRWGKNVPPTASTPYFDNFAWAVSIILFHSSTVRSRLAFH